MDPSQMRIQVAPDGNVEFSVALSSTVDPSLVASLVAAVRQGIVSSQPPRKSLPEHSSSPTPPQPTTPQPTPPQPTPPRPTPPQPSPPKPSPPSSHVTTPPEPHTEPTSDPDTARAPDRPCDRVPSPLVVSAARKLSVRQIAAEIEARPEPIPSPIISAAEYDPVREFSSSPALWLAANSNYPDPEPPRSQSSAYALGAGSSLAGDVTSSRPIYSQRISDREVDSSYPRNRHYSSARPVRMLSLPCEANHDSAAEVVFGRHRSENNFGITAVQARQNHLEHPSTMDENREIVVESDGLQSPGLCEMPHKNVQQIEKKRSLSDLGAMDYVDGDRSATPSSPYVQHPGVQDEDPDDVWDNVDYVLTESYRNDPKGSDLNERDSHATQGYSRSATWRLFSSIGTTLRRRPENGDEIHQGTLAPRPTYADKLPKRRRAIFSRNNVRNGTLWMEFTSPSSVEGILADVGRIAKTMGYQVWRRPGENKLRCIRRLTHRHEMHMVILVGSIRLPEGQMSVVRLRRARGDRNRTETWRYAHFYRELIERLQRLGIEVTSGE